MKQYLNLKMANALICELYNQSMNLWFNEKPSKTIDVSDITLDIVSWDYLDIDKAGTTILNKKTNKLKIIMNIYYLYSPDAIDFVISTFRHELAHAIAYRIEHKLGHTDTWKAMSIIFGNTMDVYHDYAEPEIF